MLSTVNDVLDFSKLDAGKLKLELQPFLIKAAIEEVSFALSSTSAAKKGIRVNTIVNLPESLVVKLMSYRFYATIETRTPFRPGREP